MAGTAAAAQLHPPADPRRVARVAGGEPQSRRRVWLITYKKATGKPRVEYDEAVEEALCFGWMDSKPNKLDDERSMLWIARASPARVGRSPTRSGSRSCSLPG